MPLSRILRRSLRLAPAVLACALAVPYARCGQVDVYLLAGQSNMQGLGSVAELGAADKAPPADTLFWNGTAFEALRPGVTKTSGNKPLSSKAEFGPEVAFAAAMASPGRRTFIVKSYRGGTALDAGWADQTYAGGTGKNRYNFYAGTGAADPERGLSYVAMIGTFTKAIEAIKSNGDTPVVKGMVWMQGEQDSKNLKSAQNYAANLQRLVTRVKQDLSLTRLPFVYGQAAPSGELPGETPVPAYVYRKELRLSQKKAASLIPLSAMVSTDGFKVLKDHAHYTTESQLKLGKAFAARMKEVEAGAASSGRK